MKNLPALDLIIIITYLAGITLLGLYFGFRRNSSRSFMIAGGNLPGWVVGLSIFGTYLSSNTFLGIPGKAFSENWNSFIFSLSIPVAALIAVKYFIPFYRRQGEISAYHQFEKRFGKWAKTYAVICFMLTQLARIGTILFGVGLILSALLNTSLWVIIVVTGVLVSIYTTAGGMEAVIWTDVVQSVLLTLGAVLIVSEIILGTHGGLQEIISAGMSNEKFSLGSWKPDFTSSTVWVVFLYGFFINLTNFGIDQNYVQRYHAARSQKEASGSIWLLARMYVPVSMLFFFIGTALFIYSINSPAFLNIIQKSIPGLPSDLSLQSHVSVIRSLNASAIGDKVLPVFIANEIPAGISGLIIAALLAAAMSTISSSMNSTATIYLRDIHYSGNKIEPDEKKDLRILKIASASFGLVSILGALGMIGVTSILDTWWVLSGIFSGGLLGLFLLGLATKANNPQSLLSVILGLLVIIWMTIPAILPENLKWLRSPFDANMIIVIGTLSIFMTGILLSAIFPHGGNKKT